ncbi:putative Rz lysis protein [Acinetobacter phage TaPaz]|nr:putative Rz lysis protein [Acinetobacter phage TaPaz]
MTLAISYMIRFWKEFLIVILFIGLLGLLMQNESLKGEYEKKLVDKDIAYVSLKNEMTSKLIEEQNNSIKKVNELNKEYTILQEKHQSEIDKITVSRNSLNADVKRLREQINKVGSGGSTNQSGNSESSIRVSRRDLQWLQESFGSCTERYLDMAEDGDKLRQSVSTLQDAWKQLEEKYNTE